MQIGTLTIIGVGLIGGSIGLAAKKRGLAQRVCGVGWRQSTLEQAQRLDAIDEAFLSIGPAAAEADFIVVCTPVQLIANHVREAARHCPTGAVITDAGSTKGRIIAEVEGWLPLRVPFVGGHPLAGSEKRGPQAADAELFQGRVTVITPTPATFPNAIERVTAFWEALGSQVRHMSPQEHDQALALTSHLPHLAASALAGLLPDELRNLTAAGFRDTTRIAAGDPGLWTGIFLHNQSALLEALGRLTGRLEAFRAALAAGDEAAVYRLLDEAKRLRDAL